MGSSNNSSSSSSGGGGGGKKGKNSKSGGGNSGGNNSNGEKPKQPQRGLGVAQLEKIRLQSQMASCGFLPPPPPHPHHHPLFPSFSPGPGPNPVPFQHMQEELRYNHHQNGMPSFGYSSPSSVAPPSSFGYPPNFMMGLGDHMERASNLRWNPNSNFGPMPEGHHYIQPPAMVTRHLLSHVEQNNGRNGLFETMGGSNSQDIEPSEKEELDLELKL